MLDTAILARFTQSFGKFDDLIADEPVPPELDGGRDACLGMQRWKPAALATDVTALRALYAQVPGPFPALYEVLVLSYRWLEVHLDDRLALFANPPGPTLQGLAENMARDPAFVEVLFPLGLIPFGKAGGCYDPICFDINHRVADLDCRIVRVEHESVLCRGRVGDTWEVAPSFRSLVEAFASKSG